MNNSVYIKLQQSCDKNITVNVQNFGINFQILTKNYHTLYINLQKTTMNVKPGYNILCKPNNLG